jgi:hypothetical protein
VRIAGCVACLDAVSFKGKIIYMGNLGFGVEIAHALFPVVANVGDHGSG